MTFRFDDFSCGDPLLGCRIGEDLPFNGKRGEATKELCRRAGLLRLPVACQMWCHDPRRIEHYLGDFGSQPSGCVIGPTP
jgi:hypothetical protein